MVGMLSKGPSHVSVTTDSLIIDEIEYDVDIPHTVENIQASLQSSVYNMHLSRSNLM